MVLLLFLNSCVEVGKELLPKSTETGANTFGMKLDGKIWLPKKKSTILASLGGVNSRYAGSSFAVGGSNEGQETIVLKILNIKSTGIFLFDSTNNNTIPATKYYDTKNYTVDEYLIFPGGINEVKITKFDTIDKIVSGSFKLQLKSKKTQSIINLSNGVFDVTYEK